MKTSILAVGISALSLVSAIAIPGPQGAVTKAATPASPTSCASEPGSTIRVTRTLNFDDVDGTKASRVPIPSGYYGFSHSEPTNNRIYMAGSSASVSPPNVVYANTGKLAFGAVGFTWNPQSFKILTFLDPANGIKNARVRVSGLFIQPFESTITKDRQFETVNFPPFDRITAVGLVIEVFAGTSGTKALPFYLDDLVYVRRVWQATCCQVNNPNPIVKLHFDDLKQGTTNVGFYKDVNISPKTEVTITPAPVQNPSQPNALYKKPTANPLILSYKYGLLNLLSLTVTISQYTADAFARKSTRIIIKGYDSRGGELGSWDVFAATYNFGTYSINLGGDWTKGNTGGLHIKGRTGGGGKKDGFFAAAAFRQINDVRIIVVEDEYGSDGRSISSTPKPFWIDDFELQAPSGCEFDYLGF